VSWSPLFYKRLVAIVLLQFDVQPLDGEWSMPETWKADVWNAMPKPDTDIPVRITPRKNMEGVQWKFVRGDS
jgi:hypothetical protein